MSGQRTVTLRSRKESNCYVCPAFAGHVQESATRFRRVGGLWKPSGVKGGRLVLDGREKTSVVSVWFEAVRN